MACVSWRSLAELREKTSSNLRLRCCPSLPLACFGAEGLKIPTARSRGHTQASNCFLRLIPKLIYSLILYSRAGPFFFFFWLQTTDSNNSRQEIKEKKSTTEKYSPILHKNTHSTHSTQHTQHTQPTKSSSPPQTVSPSSPCPQASSQSADKS